MDKSDILTADQEIILKNEICNAVRNINRCLQEWTKKENKTFTISRTELISLSRNWISKSLKSVLDWRTMRNEFRSWQIEVRFDDQNKCVTQLSLDKYTGSWRGPTITQLKVSEILENLDYNILRFIPTDQFYGETYKGFDPNFNLPFDDLRNFSFKL